MAEMQEDVRRATELAQAVGTHLANEGLAFEYALQPYDRGCMVHVDLADDDGFMFLVARTDPFGWIEVLDPGDYQLPPTALSHYVLLRARGARPYHAWKTALKADPNGKRRFGRRQPAK
jgi:hypothetical protein